MSGAASLDGGPFRRLRDLSRRESFRSGSASVLAHAALFAALSVSISWRQDVPDPLPKVETMDVSIMMGNQAEEPRPMSRIAAPDKPVPKPSEDAVQRPDKPVDQSSPQDDVGAEQETVEAEASTSAGDSEGTIWTPPAPDPNASRLVRGDDGRTRVVLPVVQMRDGASEPQLLSFDQGRYSDAASVSEAARLSGTGTIFMTVSVDDKGDVTGCQVTASSGSKALDAKGCDLVRSYKYRAARDVSGRSLAAFVSETLEWARDGRFAQPAPVNGQPTPASPARPATTLPRVSMPGSPRTP